MAAARSLPTLCSRGIEEGSRGPRHYRRTDTGGRLRQDAAQLLFFYASSATNSGLHLHHPRAKLRHAVRRGGRQEKRSIDSSTSSSESFTPKVVNDVIVLDERHDAAGTGGGFGVSRNRTRWWSSRRDPAPANAWGSRRKKAPAPSSRHPPDAPAARAHRPPPEASSPPGVRRKKQQKKTPRSRGCPGRRRRRRGRARRREGVAQDARERWSRSPCPEQQKRVAAPNQPTALGGGAPKTPSEASARTARQRRRACGGHLLGPTAARHWRGVGFYKTTTRSAALRGDARGGGSPPPSRLFFF